MYTPYIKLYKELADTTNLSKTTPIHTKIRRCFCTMWDRKRAGYDDLFFIDNENISDRSEFLGSIFNSLKMGTKSPKLKQTDVIFRIPRVTYSGYIETSGTMSRIGDKLEETLEYQSIKDNMVGFKVEVLHTGFKQLSELMTWNAFEDSKYAGIFTSTYIFYCQGQEIYHFAEIR